VLLDLGAYNYDWPGPEQAALDSVRGLGPPLCGHSKVRVGAAAADTDRQGMRFPSPTASFWEA